ncbi:fructokinase [Anaerobacterium chartisolvens]|uniref:Fructokinase n=1 Tax=Anaerobacterium chartisolvens TaxID=1297424 RepID=A0A369BIK2_9FIRM|nr:carbohydrate kinase [Anaerobacterium chartisolvens]RCX21005.1 fructokinase [Anaerobacterium chartisolvens]
MHDVCALGELLIDFTPAGHSSAGREIFERNPGGAPANVLAAVTRLGGTAAFIGKVGKDRFGDYLKSVLEENRIASDGLVFSKDVNTTLAFVHLSEAGDRSFSFYRKPGADITLLPEEVNLEAIDRAKIFHFGSLSMTDEPSRSATIKALDYAKERGRLISFDPNWRPALWKSSGEARENMLLGLRYADILKVSEDELSFLSGESDMLRGCAVIAKKGVKTVIVTLGPKGCFFSYEGGNGYVNTYDTKIVDTTGAGDAFLGGLLYRISNSGRKPEHISIEEMRDMMLFSNAVGAVCAAGFGAIPSMPEMQAVQECMSKVPLLLY